MRLFCVVLRAVPRLAGAASLLALTSLSAFAQQAPPAAERRTVVAERVADGERLNLDGVLDEAGEA